MTRRTAPRIDKTLAGLSSTIEATDPADMSSGAAADGHVLTADGAGGAAWEAPTGGGGGGVTTALYLSGASGNTVTAPDSATLSFAGDFDLRVKVTLDVWNTQQMLMEKYNNTNTEKSWRFYKLAGGALRLAIYTNGTDFYNLQSNALDLAALAAGATKWIRAVFDVDNGAGGSTATFYTSDDGTAWTAYGTVTPNVPGGASYDSTAPITVGGVAESYLAGLVHNAALYDSTGTLVAAWDGSWPHTRQRDTLGNIWTVNGTANAWQEI